MIILTVSHPFSVLGLPTNFDYWFSRNILLRFEGKWFESPKPIFNNSNREFYLTSSLSFILEKK